MSLHPVIAEVTARIVERSRATRADRAVAPCFRLVSSLRAVSVTLRPGLALLFITSGLQVAPSAGLPSTATSGKWVIRAMYLDAMRCRVSSPASDRQAALRPDM